MATLTISPTTATAYDANTTVPISIVLLGSSASLVASVAGGGTINTTSPTTALIYTPPATGSGTATVTVNDATDGLSVTCTISYIAFAPDSATSYVVLGYPATPLRGRKYPLTVALNGATSAGVITFPATPGIAWNGGATNTASTITVTTGTVYFPASVIFNATLVTPWITLSHTGTAFTLGDAVLPSVAPYDTAPLVFRGLWTHLSVLYAVLTDALYSIDSTGAMRQVGNLNSSSGQVDFASLPNQLTITDGSYLYVYDPIAQTLTTAANYPGGDRISFLNQRINFQYRGTGQFGWTSLLDAKTIDVLEYFTAETAPDNLVAHVSFDGELILAGQWTTEIWDPTASTDSAGSATVYEKSTAAINYGCVAPFTMQKTAGSVFMLARDERGQTMVLAIRGHQGTRISTRSQEERLQGLQLQNATAYTYSLGMQSYYCLNVPGLDCTMVYDESVQQWHDRAEWDGAWKAWRPTCHAFAYGNHYFAAGTSLLIQDANENTYAGAPKRRTRVAPVVSSPDRKRVFYPSFEVVCEKGTGGTAELRYSDDNGYNWSTYRQVNLGAPGNFKARGIVYRLGSGRDRVFELSYSDPYPFNPVQVNIPLT